MGFRFGLNAETVAWLSVLLLGLTSAQQLEELRSALEDVRLHDQPAPTPPPTPLLVRGDSEGRKRQLLVSSSQTGLGTTTFSITQAPDKTCGFLSGSVGVPITCDNGQKCSWETEYIGAVYCGWGDSYTTPKLRCIERAVATNTASCNDVCQLNAYNLLCTNATAPFCGTFAFPNGVRAYRCASETQTVASSVSFRYSGEIECMRAYTTTVLGDDITTTINNCAPVHTTTRSSVSSTPVTSTTSDPVSRDSSTVTPTSSDPPVAAGGGSSNNTGAIVGGVVGGVAVLGLIGLGAFFLIRRSRRGAADTNNANTNPQPFQQQPHQGQYQTDPKYYGGGPGSPGGPPMSEVYYATGPSPTTSYDPAFKGHQGSVSVDPNQSPPTAISQTFSPHPSQHHPALSTATSQDFGSISRASYASTGAPPVYQPQPGAFPQQQVVGQPMSAIHEIGSGDDHHHGRLHEVQ
ncbi:hypothetical protein QBC35DRAFT_454234 [Podospora australis]|uniref:Uncharacterized protein n=1 Tax=Podospora australis TaxID=1536484 RepID=A0AAN6WSC8_9PEZI|nr:hypothetical protein QBC35DRAFT_454234 [Podospora australis]